jgi:hypothetical protein
MNHPTRDQWLSFLYGESGAGERLRLLAHLRLCQDCKAVIDEWQATGRDLDAWQLPSPKSRAPLAPPVFKWVAAAIIILSLGIGLGRLWAAGNMEKLRAAVEPEIRAQLRLELARIVRDTLDETKEAALAAASDRTQVLIAENRKALEAQRKADNQAVFAALNDFDSRRIADFLLLKKELDTVAQNTAVGLSKTERQLIQLASYTQPIGSSNSFPQ